MVYRCRLSVAVVFTPNSGLAELSYEGPDYFCPFRNALIDKIEAPAVLQQVALGPIWIAGLQSPGPETIQPLHFVPATPPLREVAGLTVIKSLI